MSVHHTQTIVHDAIVTGNCYLFLMGEAGTLVHQFSQGILSLVIAIGSRVILTSIENYLFKKKQKETKTKCK